MRQRLRCCWGHHWEVPLHDRLQGGLALVACPQCGAIAESLGPQERTPGQSGEEEVCSTGCPAPSDTPAGYEILGVLGEGGMGVVYQARERDRDRLVALKMPRPEMALGPRTLARFRAEAEVLAQLRHPHIVRLHDLGAQEGRPYLSLEYIPGSSLAEHLNGRPHSPWLAARLVRTLAQAIHHVHQRGIIHRDLKPANILLQGTPAPGGEDTFSSVALSGPPRIIDFGLAWRREAEGVSARAGEVLGTPAYMAPEQAAGNATTIGPATDVYALGVILHELLTGRLPIEGATSREVLEQVRFQNPVSLQRWCANIPRELERICLKCLEKGPQRRYPSAQALAGALRDWLCHEARERPAWEKDRK